ncbi:MAG TPA: VOC family protein [Dehalococcoidia bacterium]|nr:VOC family protein [Dehalococcoidia bacterium]
MSGVKQLGYLSIGVSDPEGWRAMATRALGLEIVPGDGRSTSYLRMDEHHHRIELRKDGTDDLQVVGWEVPDSATLQAVAQRLEDAGVPVQAGTRDEADQRRVLELIKFQDPGGIPTEIYYGQPLNQKPFHPARAISGYKTGDMGLGHLVVYQPDLEASLRFYTELLGFRVSDVIGPAGHPLGVFLHCNARHHSIALFAAPHASKRINHFMLEANSLDDVGSGRDICRQQGLPIVIDLGRHMNDHMVSFYLGNPSQFAIEYGWGARTVDDSCWQVGHYESVESIWGHPELSQMAAQMAQAAAAAD